MYEVLWDPCSKMSAACYVSLGVSRRNEKRRDVYGQPNLSKDREKFGSMSAPTRAHEQGLIVI
jgi:hypothetical protein